MSGIKKKTVLDLFSGCGGMSLGFEQAGFEIKLGIDNWNDALLTFKNNHKNSNILENDLSLLEPSEIGIDSIDVIIGGPPCQGFSIAGKRIIEDDRNDLYKSFVRFVDYFKPKAFVMENVPNILSMEKGVVKSKIIKDFSSLGYNVNCQVLMSSDYGVPQNRKRAFFVGLKNNENFEFPQLIDKRKITSKEAISDLPDISITDGSKYPLPSTSNYQKEIRNGSK